MNGQLLKLYTKHRQFVLYTAIGLSGVVVDYIAFALGVKMLGLGVLLANFISISLGIVNNFYLNSRFNFKVSDNWKKRFGLFYSVGTLGIILSEFLIIVFHNGFGVGELTAKLLTLPFVLAFQFVLNKKFSFGDLERVEILTKRVLIHWPAMVITAIFLILSMTFVKTIPADYNRISPSYAPDESVHYNFNVGFILAHKRLPVSGKDDLEAYKACRDNPSGKVSCLYSYTFYPGASYLANVLSAGVVPKVINMTPQVAARLPSTFYGAVFILTTYAATLLVSRRRHIATLATAAVALIPQFIFTSSYVNLDAHSIAISGLLGLAFVMFALQPKKTFNIAFLAVVAGGLLPLAKYNYFILILPVFVLVAHHYRQRQINWQTIRHLTYWAVGSFIVLSGFWYARNIILYHDPLGQGFALKEMSKYHWLGKTHKYEFGSIAYLSQLGFNDILFNSIFVAYGGMFHYLAAGQYVVPGATLVGCLVYLVTQIAIDPKLKTLRWVTAGFLALVALAIGQIIYNSLIFDFQPQGRYLYPLLAPLAIFLSYTFRSNKRFAVLSMALASSTLYILWYGLDLIFKVYVHVSH